MGQSFNEQLYRRKLMDGNLNSQLALIRDEIPEYKPKRELDARDWNSPINLFVAHVVKRNEIKGVDKRFKVGKWDG